MERRTTGIISFMLLIFLTGIRLQAQETYFVTFVKGEVKNANSVKIKTGDKLQFQDKVIFATKDDKLVLLNPQKGRFIIQPENNTEKVSGEYMLYLKYSMHLSNEKVKLSSRGDNDAVLEQYFTANPAINKNILFIGDTKISLVNAAYKIKDPASEFFFLQYTAPGSKPLNHKLKVEHDSLVLSENDFVFDGKKVTDSGEVKLGILQQLSAEKKPVKIVSFYPSYISKEDCLALMNTIKQALGNDKQKVVEETCTQLYYNYGKPDHTIINALYDQL